MKTIFKPSGRIHSDYPKFVFLIIVNGILSGISSVISTDQMFSALNKGNLTPNFVGKDIIGQLGSLLVTDKLSKMKSDKILKSSIVIYELSNLVECCSPLFQEKNFIIVASGANIGKNIGFIGLGAFNSEVINKMSIDKDNIPQIYSKIAIFSSISFSFGMTIGLYFIKQFPDFNSRLGIISIIGVTRYFTLTKLSVFNTPNEPNR